MSERNQVGVRTQRLLPFWQLGLLGLVFASPGLAAAAEAQTEPLTGAPDAMVGGESKGEGAGVDEPMAQRPDTSGGAYTWQFLYKADLVSVHARNLSSRAALLGNLDAKLSIDGEKAWGIGGATIFLHALSAHGGKPNERLGSTMGIDNIEVGTATAKLYQAYWAQDLAAGKFNLLGGLYDLNSEFYVTDSASSLIHPSFGIGAEAGLSGQNGPSIFPTTSLAVRATWKPASDWYAQLAVMDGVPGDTERPRGTHIKFARGDGALWAGEVGTRFGKEGQDGKLAAGAWRYTARFNDLSEVDGNGDPLRRVSQGAYLLGEHRLYQAPDHAERSLSGFLRVGMANGQVNTLDRNISAGLLFRGICPLRLEDSLVFGVSHGRYGTHLRDAQHAAGDPAPTAEMAYELTYRAVINKWLTLQPDLQWIRTRGDSGAHALVAGLRMEFSF